MGGHGLLGSAVSQEMSEAGFAVLSLRRTDFDLTDPTAAAEWALDHLRPGDVVINAAAYTDVEGAETNVDAAFAVNALGPSYLAQACQASGARLMHISTDFVFGHGHSRPISEEAAPSPLGVYGESKLQGERSILQQATSGWVFRTAWLFGPHGKCFPRTILQAWLAGKSLRVVDDQFGSPTSTLELAKWIRHALDSGLEPGLYHAVGPEILSWHELASATVRAAQELGHGLDLSPEVTPVPASEWPSQVTRPAYSALSSERLLAQGFPPMRAVADSLSDLVAKIL